MNPLLQQFQQLNAQRDNVLQQLGALNQMIGEVLQKILPPPSAPEPPKVQPDPEPIPPQAAPIEPLKPKKGRPKKEKVDELPSLPPMENKAALTEPESEVIF